jgi:catechol 2,3-dioxygenase-like lactoylglutathione lyase family enzyme
MNPYKTFLLTFTSTILAAASTIAMAQTGIRDAGPTSTAAQTEQPPAASQNSSHLVADHATVVVADMDKETKWYVDVLGFHKRGCMQSTPGRPPFLQHPATVCGMTNGSFAIDFIQEPGAAPHHPESDYLQEGWSDLCFFDTSLNDTYKRLTELGVRIRADKNGKGEVNHIMIWDPEGNQIAIASFSEAQMTR